MHSTRTYQLLHAMKGALLKIVFKEEPNPHAVRTPIPVPHHWKKQVKADLDRDVQLGIIERVQQGEVTKWCSRMVIAPKRNGE